MYFKIETKCKQEVFLALFQLLKNWTTLITLHFKADYMCIFSMDKSHICFADVRIEKEWFTEYIAETENKITVDSTSLALLLTHSTGNDVVEFKFEDEEDPDKLYINFLNAKEKKSFDHYYELPLTNVEEDPLNIPEHDYDVELTIESKKLGLILAELNVFGQNLHIKCNENVLEFRSNGDIANTTLNVPIDDLSAYAIAEGEELNVSFSLPHILKMCTSMKLSTLVDIGLSDEYPMFLKYHLGEHSEAKFYIAPKIKDDD